MAQGGEIVLQNRIESSESRALWVFGYGSLCWKPGFDFDKAVVGHVRGFSRKFWQGNTTHRGTVENPGRVATLIDDDKSRVHGVAFAVSGENAIPYLNNRECTLGGYETRFATFFPLFGEPVKVLVYIATPRNDLWLGDGDAKEVAAQILNSAGPCGHNVEYLLRLTGFVRKYFPDEMDTHLFELEHEVVNGIKERDMCLSTLMGNGDGCISFDVSMINNPQRRNRVENERVDSFQFTTRVPEKSLRCLDI